MKLDSRKLDINRFKELYVKNMISNQNYDVLSEDYAAGEVYKIKGFGTSTINGYEHGFLYLKAGSSIKKHKHTEDIELYNIIDDGIIISSKICILNDYHEINCVENDTIVETFKLDKKIINDLYDECTLNKCMIVQLDRYLWRLNKILNLLAMDDEDISWRSMDNISHVYNISVDSLESIYDIYFKNVKDIPYIPLTFDEIKEEINWNNVPYVIDEMYKVYDFSKDKNKLLIKK